jgi:hypothetical protein
MRPRTCASAQPVCDEGYRMSTESRGRGRNQAIPTDVTDEAWISIRALAKETSLHELTIRAEIKRGNLKIARIGRSIRITDSRQWKRSRPDSFGTQIGGRKAELETV